MDIGLYQAKHPFRKLIGWLVPLCKTLNPNWISLSLLPVGGLMAWCCWQALQNGQSLFLLYAIFLGFLRMVLATLDGMVATTYSKSTCVGDILNRITPEVCDLMLYPVLVLAVKPPEVLGLAVLSMSWAIGFAGSVGAPSGVPVQSVGPCGQTDRLAATMITCALQCLFPALPLFKFLLYWILLGGLLTIVLRVKRTLKIASETDRGV
ncbi:MAG: hypothetical protein U0931_29910 [Vulcanimicrobiota bacterium]